MKGVVITKIQRENDRFAVGGPIRDMVPLRRFMKFALSSQ